MGAVMVNRASLFLALRYLRPKRSFVSVITTISVLGVAVGVLMMVVVRAVMLGFEADFRDILMGAEPHVLISKEESALSAPPWQDVLKKVSADAAITSAAPYAGGMLYMAVEDEQTATQVLGVSHEDGGAYIEKLKPHVLDGSLDLPQDTIVICDEHAVRLGVRVGDEISVYTDKNVNQAVREFSASNEEDSDEKRKEMRDKIKLNPAKLRVSGVIRAETGGMNGYVALATGQKLFRLGDEVTGIAVELKDAHQAAALSQGWKQNLPGWKFTLWTDAGESRLAAMQNEQIMMQFVLMIIAVVAAFSVMNTTITVTTQKRREIGVLSALGSKPGQIVSVFLLQAVVVGVVGTGVGLAGSLLVLWLRNDIRDLLTFVTGGQVHAVEGVFFSTIPAQIQPWDITLTCLLSVALCVVAGLIPAWFASRVDAAVALRD